MFRRPLNGGSTSPQHQPCDEGAQHTPGQHLGSDVEVIVPAVGTQFQSARRVQHEQLIGRQALPQLVRGYPPDHRDEVPAMIGSDRTRWHIRNLRTLSEREVRVVERVKSPPMRLDKDNAQGAVAQSLRERPGSPSVPRSVGAHILSLYSVVPLDVGATGEDKQLRLLLE